VNENMNISIIGSGYVGLVSGACFAELGNKVICVDNNSEKIASLKKGIMPIYEPGLKDLVKTNIKMKRLKFTTSTKEAVTASRVIFISVNTPPLENGGVDITDVENVARHIAVNMTGYRLIVEKSTVPVATGEKIKHVISTYVKHKVKFDIASNPEFLREGQAINDFMHPDRVVIGVESKQAKDILVSLYQPLHATLVVTDIKSAELIKHASNSFLATKISFINVIANICDIVGADVVEVAKGMGLDKRISRAFLDAGIGYGGSCFPKDVDAFIHIAEKIGYNFELLKAVRGINRQQINLFLNKIKDALWVIKDKTIGILGLSFKPNTDDIRNAPAIEIIKSLLAEDAKLRVFDPQAMKKTKAALSLGNCRRPTSAALEFCRDAYDTSKGCDCLLVITEWDEFKELDFGKIKKLLKRPIIIDGRNIYEPLKMQKLGFTYIGTGTKGALKQDE